MKAIKTPAGVVVMVGGRETTKRRETPVEKYVSFDIETYGSVEQPEGITCAATLTESGKLEVWHPGVGEDGRYKPKMSIDEMARMVGYLKNEFEINHRRPLAFNGVSFDFRVLWEQCAGYPVLQDEIKALAVEQIDPAFHMWAEKGFMCGLAALSKGMGASGKMEGFDGHKAAELWMVGSRADQDKILEYVAQDVVTTREVYDAIQANGRVVWVNLKGKLSVWVPSGYKIVPARELLDLGRFVGRQVWMTGEYVWTKEKMIGWLGYA